MPNNKNVIAVTPKEIYDELVKQYKAKGNLPLDSIHYEVHRKIMIDELANVIFQIGTLPSENNPDAAYISYMLDARIQEFKNSN